jgi:hypothetical protein
MAADSALGSDAALRKREREKGQGEVRTCGSLSPRILGSVVTNGPNQEVVKAETITAGMDIQFDFYIEDPAIFILAGESVRLRHLALRDVPATLCGRSTNSRKFRLAGVQATPTCLTCAKEQAMLAAP